MNRMNRWTKEFDVPRLELEVWVLSLWRLQIRFQDRCRSTIQTALLALVSRQAPTSTHNNNNNNKEQFRYQHTKTQKKKSVNKKPRERFGHRKLERQQAPSMDWLDLWSSRTLPSHWTTLSPQIQATILILFLFVNKKLKGKYDSWLLLVFVSSVIECFQSFRTMMHRSTI